MCVYRISNDYLWYLHFMTDPAPSILQNSVEVYTCTRCTCIFMSSTCVFACTVANVPCCVQIKLFFWLFLHVICIMFASTDFLFDFHEFHFNAVYFREIHRSHFSSGHRLWLLSLFYVNMNKFALAVGWMTIVGSLNTYCFR